MLDVERVKVLRDMTQEQLAEVAQGLGLRWPAPLGIVSILAAEFERDNPQAAAELDRAFGTVKHYKEGRDDFYA